MLTLHPATPTHMPYRQAMMADPATMAYNAPWFPPDGTIPFPKENWPDWLDEWINHEPERFCGYLAAEDGTLVGEVCWHGYGAGMGIVIHADHRGKGYGAQGLQLLLQRAFSHPEIAQMENNFESTRDPALRLHQRAGFVDAGTDEDGYLMLRLTRERYQEHLLRSLFDAMCAWEKGVPERIHHFIKVHGFARQIALHEETDAHTRFILEAAALTHDIGIRPAIEQTGACPGPLQERLGAPEGHKMLTSLGFAQDVTDRVCFLIGHHHTIEGVDGPDWRILLEADFLVNMVENRLSPEAVARARDAFFRTEEGLRLLDCLQPS